MNTTLSPKISNLKIQRVPQSRIGELNLEVLKFGREFSDHMVEMNFSNGAWEDPQIKPYGPVEITPACSTLHYGQAIFEGMKAYYTEDGRVVMFRPEKNAVRFNKSAKRISMPEIPEQMFLGLLNELVNLDKKWVPKKEGYSLYLRPYMYATDNFIGVRTAESYRFCIFTCPAGAYYTKRIKVKVADHYVRAFAGGTGDVKFAGNYGATLFPAKEIAKDGFDQVLWTDGIEHKYIHEIGTMNVFFVIDGVAITPPTDGQILEGVTRDSVITLMKDEGVTVEERNISIDEIVEASDKGLLQDAFGAGTAATISPIAEINYKGKALLIDEATTTISQKVKARMTAIKEGREEDKFGWLYTVG